MRVGSACYAEKRSYRCVTREALKLSVIDMCWVHTTTGKPILKDVRPLSSSKGVVLVQYGLLLVRRSCSSTLSLCWGTSVAASLIVLLVPLAQLIFELPLLLFRVNCHQRQHLHFSRLSQAERTWLTRDTPQLAQCFCRWLTWYRELSTVCPYTRTPTLQERVGRRRFDRRHLRDFIRLIYQIALLHDTR